MKFNKQQVLGLLLGSLSVFHVSAANITLKDGRIIEGEITSQNSDALVLDMSGIEVILPLNQISSVDLSGNNQANDEKQQTTEQPATEQEKSGSELETGIATVSAGSTLVVKINDGFNSRHNKTGQRFSGVLESNLIADGVLVAPKGSPVYGELTEVKKAGRMAGSAMLSFELTDISIGGTMQSIQTQTMTGEGDNTAKSTAGKTARASAIGGLANGSSGAKNGAKVGLGASLVTQGSDIAVPEDALIDFVLIAPFTPS